MLRIATTIIAPGGSTIVNTATAYGGGPGDTVRGVGGHRLHTVAIVADHRW